MKTIQRFARGLKPGPAKQLKQEDSFSLAQLKKHDMLVHRKYKLQAASFQYDLRTLELYGNTCFIAGTQDSSIEALNQNLALLEQKSPRCVLLDYFSHRDLMERIGMPINQDPEKRLLGRNAYTTYFAEVVPKEGALYVQHDNNSYVYHAIPQTQSIYLLDSLSVAYFACNDPKMHLLISKPDQLRMIEDIVLRFELDELKDMFDQIVKRLKEEQAIIEFTASDSNEDILNSVKRSALSMFPKLWINYNSYQAALLHKSARLFDKCALYTSHYLTEEVARKSSQEYFDYYALFNHQPIKGVPKEVILEKIVIAGYLYDFTMRQMALRGENPFSQTIFKDFLGPKDIPLYLKLHERYTEMLHNYQNFLIESLVTKDLEQESFVKYSQIVSNFKKKAQSFDYDFEIAQQSRFKQRMVLNQLLTAQMAESIEERRAQGVNQKDMLRSVQAILKEKISEKDLKNLLKLHSESNAKLGYPIQYPAHLKELVLPFLQNSQVDRVAREVSGLKFGHLSNRIVYAEIKQDQEKVENPNELTDEDEASDDEQNRFVKTYLMGEESQLSELPEELRHMSSKEIEEQSELIGQYSFSQNKYGEMDVHEISTPKVNIDELLSSGGKDLNEVDSEESEDEPPEGGK